MAVVISLGAYGDSDQVDNNWPMWRGPDASGAAPEGCNPPLTWSATENIKWKYELPGSGDSSPVIWGDQIFFLTAIPVAVEQEEIVSSEPLQRTQRSGQRQRRTGGRGGRVALVKHKFDLVCVDRKTGKLLWQTTADETTPHEGHHADHGFASYSPVTDGQKIWASFGSRGTHCFDMNGKKLWSKDLGQLRTRNGFGEGNSCNLAGDAVIVMMDQEDDSFIYALNKDSGEILWKKARDESTGWATPIPVEVNGKLQVVINAQNFIRSYDVATGDLVWQCSGQVSNVIPTPVLGNGMVYCTSGYRGASLQAIKLGNRGDLSGTDAVAWHVTEACPYVASPLIYENKIYVTSVTQAILSCYDAVTGKPYFVKQRVDDMRSIYSSPVGAAGRVYVIGRNGTCKVLSNSGKYEVLATNVLNDPIDASPMIIGDEIYLKGDSYLYCIAENK
ncbi:MAG: PQQ-binding-like beta-propeller repeat protein [Planctomycetes bacterium]|nr:PQQ-binding-like beta-propeller repeat protein [Planctomycetota bacterium]